jgi:hypothetical protein
VAIRAADDEARRLIPRSEGPAADRDEEPDGPGDEEQADGDEERAEDDRSGPDLQARSPEDERGQDDRDRPR